jgi:hypothetical protein
MERLVGSQQQLRQDSAAISAEHQVEGLSGHAGILICSHFRYNCSLFENDLRCKRVVAEHRIGDKRRTRRVSDDLSAR